MDRGWVGRFDDPNIKKVNFIKGNQSNADGEGKDYFAEFEERIKEENEKRERELASLNPHFEGFPTLTVKGAPRLSMICPPLHRPRSVQLFAPNICIIFYESFESLPLAVRFPSPLPVNNERRYLVIHPRSSACPECFSFAVKQARDLMNASPEGFSDPYVVLSVAGKKAKSKIDKKTLDPFWDFAHELYAFLVSLRPSSLFEMFFC